MNNMQIGLHNLFAIIGLGVSLLLLGLGGQFILDTNHYESYSDDPLQHWMTIICCSVGVLCLFLSIALMMRAKWARLAFQVVLILGGIAWLIFMLFLITDSKDAWAIILGMTAFGVTVSLSGVLLLESPHFQQDLQQRGGHEKERWDILDQ